MFFFAYRLSDCSDSGGSADSLLPRFGTGCSSGSSAAAVAAAAVSADFDAAAGSAAVPGFDSYS